MRFDDFWVLFNSLTRKASADTFTDPSKEIAKYAWNAGVHAACDLMPSGCPPVERATQVRNLLIAKHARYEPLKSPDQRAFKEGVWAGQHGMSEADNFYGPNGMHYDGADSQGLALSWYNGWISVKPIDAGAIAAKAIDDYWKAREKGVDPFSTVEPFGIDSLAATGHQPVNVHEEEPVPHVPGPDGYSGPEMK